jgi:broad-specificity NMP kinase
MGMKNILVEGVSGSGKTTVAEELERRGHHVIHGDRELGYFGDPETGVALDKPTFDTEAKSVIWLNAHWIWSVEKVKTLIADHVHPVTFFCGNSRNFHHFILLFDKVFILTVDHNTLMQRLVRRPEDEFGGRAVERELIARLHRTEEDLPKSGVRIDATRAVRAVVDELLAKM